MQVGYHGKVSNINLIEGMINQRFPYPAIQPLSRMTIRIIHITDRFYDINLQQNIFSCSSNNLTYWWLMLSAVWTCENKE